MNDFIDADWFVNYGTFPAGRFFKKEKLANKGSDLCNFLGGNLMLYIILFIYCILHGSGGKKLILRNIRHCANDIY